MRNDIQNKNRAYSSLENDLYNSNQKIGRLESNISDKRRENSNLNSRVYNKNQEIRDLESRLEDKTRENRRLQSSLDEYKSRERQEREDEKKRDIHVYPHSRMSYSMQNEAIETAKRSLNLHSFNSDRAEYIRDHFDNKYGKCWHCSVGKDFYSMGHFNSNYFVHFRVGVYEFFLMKCG